MKEFLPILNKVSLFEQIAPTDLSPMLKCLGAKAVHYPANSTILQYEQAVTAVGIVVSGTAKIIHEDLDGNRTLIGELWEGELFAESFACVGIKNSPVCVLAESRCDVIWIDFVRIISTCNAACAFHTTLISNMLKLIARKNIQLNSQIDVISKRGIRAKLLAYFEHQMDHAGSRSFTIPFTRNELSDYLCVDRSALSRELCKLRDEGILTFHKNAFVLH